MRKVITYGTFDTLHFGHIRLLHRAKALGDYLIVGLSTDAFNATKGKVSLLPFAERRMYLEAIRHVDLIIPEDNWDQKQQDIQDHHVDVLTMGSDWTGHFDNLAQFCEVRYLERTPEISSTLIKESIAPPTPQGAQ